MPRLSRRSFLAATAAALSAPAVGRAVAAEQTDVVIIGAGVAGIAAAHHLAGHGKRVIVLEAADRIGGRCRTDTETFGIPCDLGAHWLHMPDINPLAKRAPAAGFDVYPAPRGQKVRIGRRYARAGELEDYLAGLIRAERAIHQAARGKQDVACARALPETLDTWQDTVGFVLGPFGCGKDLDQVSAKDFAQSAERDVDAFCRQGLGALVARLGADLAVRLSTPATAINWTRDVTVETPAGPIAARKVIVTASTGVLGANRIAFTPELPKRQQEAISQLTLGSYDHIIVELAGNPLGLRSDELVFEKASDKRTAALLANVSGTPLTMIEVGGSFGRALTAQGGDAMLAFARDWLRSLYGDAIVPAIRRSLVTRWNHEPWVMGAFSAAAPGGQGARQVLMEALGGRVFFAGEAAHETLWGTAGGAWLSGERAAQAVLNAIEPPPPPPRREPRRRPRRRRH